jgi:uncharacterized protein
MDKEKKLFWFSLDVFLIVLVIGIIFFAIPMVQKIGEGFYPSRTITVTAEGKTTASPDLAEISFSVITQGQNPATLSDKNNQKMAAVLQFVKSQSIAEEDIKTTNYDLSPNYQWDKNTERNYIVGYTLTQTVLVKVRDLSKVASVIGGLTPLGANQIGGIVFTFADEEKVLAAARADAFAKAGAKAKEMAAAAGVSLGKVMSVSENNYIPTQRSYYAADAATGMGGGMAPVAPTIQPGTQDITDTVSITYQLN